MARPGRVSREQTTLAGGAPLTTLRGRQPGPTLALLGGVHGDEDEGVLAVHLVVKEVAELPLVGTLRAVSPANPIAWAAQSRTCPLDGENLARCFPGDSEGSPTAVLARGITDNVIDGADALIDLHSAGLRYRMPLFCGFTRASTAAEGSERAAVAFGAPLIWVHANAAPGRSLSVAAERGIPAVYVECSGGGSIWGGELDAYVLGVLSVMADLGMVPVTLRRFGDAETQWVYGTGDLDKGAQARHDGLFVGSTSVKSVVPEGGEIGRIFDYQGRLLETFLAPHEGIVMFLRRQARTQVDDVLFILARLEDGQE